jgi:DeoR family transcriptional regulator of aga operon
VVADSSKIGVTAFARICGLEAVQELITDNEAAADALAGIRSAGVKVTVV